MSDDQLNDIIKAAGEYVKWALEARKRYINLRLHHDLELNALFIKFADFIAKVIRDQGTKSMKSLHLEKMEADLRHAGSDLHHQLTDKMKSYVQAGVKVGIDFNRQVTFDLLDKADIQKEPMIRAFHRVNQSAVEAMYSRSVNGLHLSDRLWEKSNDARDIIRKIIIQSVATGESAVDTARLLEKYVRDGKSTLTEDFPHMMERLEHMIPGNLSYEALRLARTELAAAYGEGTIASSRVSPSYLGMKWNLSPSHPVEDVCDHLADHDEGLGKGVYAPGNEPQFPAHPNCLCFLTAKHEDSSSFVQKLKEWRKAPSSHPDLEQWYRDVYLKNEIA
jgi:hypothetical protein